MCLLRLMSVIGLSLLNVFSFFEVYVAFTLSSLLDEKNCMYSWENLIPRPGNKLLACSIVAVQFFGMFQWLLTLSDVVGQTTVSDHRKWN